MSETVVPYSFKAADWSAETGSWIVTEDDIMNLTITEKEAAYHVFLRMRNSSELVGGPSSRLFWRPPFPLLKPFAHCGMGLLFGTPPFEVGRVAYDTAGPNFNAFPGLIQFERIPNPATVKFPNSSMIAVSGEFGVPK